MDFGDFENQRNWSLLLNRNNIKTYFLNIRDHENQKPFKENLSTGLHNLKVVNKTILDQSAIATNVLSNLNLHIAIIDSDGSLISVNGDCEHSSTSKNPLHVSKSTAGSNYFTVCKDGISVQNHSVAAILKQIAAVHNKQKNNFSSEYVYKFLEKEKYFLINVFPLSEDESKTVITHQTIPKPKKVDGSTAELKSKLAEYKTLVDSSLDMICTLKSDGSFITVNYTIETILGYSNAKLTAKNLIDFIYEDDIELTLNAFNKLMAGKKVPLIENRCVNKSGTIVPLLWSINFDEERQLLYCVGKVITEKKRLEKAIIAERDQFDNIFQNAPAGSGMLRGPNHVFEMANRFYLKFVDQENIVGKTVLEVMPEVAGQGFIKILDEVFATGKSYVGKEVYVKINNPKSRGLSEHYINFVYQAYRNSVGVIDGILFFLNDVTEQVLAKKRIESSEKRYRQILETAQEGIWVIDKDSRTAFVNKKICEIFGYTEEEIIGRKNSDFMDAESQKAAQLSFKRRMEGKSENIELTFISKKGENILTNVSVTPIYDEHDQFTGALGMLSNITEKKHLENLLEKSNRLARIGSWEVDVTTGSVFWSAITKEIREVEADFVPDLPTGIDYFTEGFDKQTIKSRIDQCIKYGIPWDEELQITTFKGNLKWVRTIGEAVFVNGKCSKIYGSFQDITERKIAVEKVLRSESRLNVAQLIAQVGSWEINIKTNNQSWSAEFCRILEVEEGTVPSYETFYPLIYREDRAKVLKAMSEAFPKQKDSSFDFRFIRKNGELGYASSEWRFEFDSSGNPINIYGILRDLTKEKKDENERAKMISDITQRNKDLEQFSYIISHNLRAPVANIIGLAEELKYESHDAESKLMLTEAMSSDVKRLENVIADLNTILQTKREITERKELVSLSELVDNIKHSINDLIEKRGVYIKTDFSEIDNVNIIKSYIHSIFYNLISNSIKYRKLDSDAVIEIKSYISNGKFCLEFKDNGRGIDLETKGDQIFGLYKRFHSDTEGKGMGLYMVKTQLEALGGRITAVSKVNIGTTFTLDFENNTHN